MTSFCSAAVPAASSAGVSPPEPLRSGTVLELADETSALRCAGAKCTWFLPAPEGRSARKRWILGTLEPQGSLTVDGGAARALAAGKSLLPAGVREVEGDFDEHVRAWARGLARLGRLVLLRWAHEMNGTWCPWGLGVDWTTAD